MMVAMAMNRAELAAPLGIDEIARAAVEPPLRNVGPPVLRKGTAPSADRNRSNKARRIHIPWNIVRGNVRADDVRQEIGMDGVGELPIADGALVAGELRKAFVADRVAAVKGHRTAHRRSHEKAADRTLEERGEVG
jgi:hypothetical protein